MPGASEQQAGGVAETLARFKREPSPALLERALEQTAGVPRPLAEARRAWSQERAALLGAFLAFFEFIESERDPAFAREGKLVLKVLPPQATRESDPEAWAAYQRRKEEHALEAARFRLQYHLGRAEALALARAERFVATHFQPSEPDRAALWAALGPAAIPEERKQRLAGLVARTVDAGGAQRESTPALAGMLEGLRAERDPDRLYQWLSLADQAGAAVMERLEEHLRLRRAAASSWFNLLAALDHLLEPGFAPGLPPALPPGFHSSTVSDPAARARHQQAVAAARARRELHQHQLWVHQCAERAVTLAAEFVAAAYTSAPRERFELDQLLEGAPLGGPRRTQLRAAFEGPGRSR